MATHFRALACIALSLFCVSQLRAQTSVQMPHKKVTVTRQNGNAVFQGASLFGEPGHPDLPLYSVKFLLPSDADLNRVSVEMQELQERQVEGSFEVDAALPPATSKEIIWPDDPNIVDGKDVTIYEKNAFYPQSYLGKHTTGKLRQFKLVSVPVTPFRYNPVTKKLKKIVGGRITVYSTSQPSVDDARQGRIRGGETYREKIRSMTVNFDNVASSYGMADTPSLMSRDAAGDMGVYAILTTAEIVAASTKLQEFIDSKQERGFEVQVHTQSSWGGGSGDQAADNIRAWLQTNYLAEGFDYVLLIGDPDPNDGAVPMKMSWPRLSEIEDRNCPTDYYFAELSGDWDLNDDGYFGDYSADYRTGGADQYPDLAVGRIPFYGSIAELDHILAKSIAYENEPASTMSWRTKALLPMEPDSKTPRYHLGEQITENILAPQGWEKTRIYEENYGVNPQVSPCSYASVYQSWSADTFGVVIWWTHGGSSHAAEIMQHTTTEHLNDANPAFTFQASCKNSYPEISSNLSYSLLKNGVIGSVGATRVSWKRPSQRDYTNTSTNAGLSYGFAEFFINDGESIADALNDAKSSRDVNSNTRWMNWLVMVVYGDPSLGVYTSPDNFLHLANTPDTKIYLGESFEPIDLNQKVFSSQYADNQVQWSISGEASLTVTISDQNIATVAPPNPSWRGHETIVFTAETPDGATKADTVVFEIAEEPIYKTITATVFDHENGTDASIPAWNPSTIYLADDSCTHDGHLWRAQWWTQNQEPGTQGQWGVWQDLGEYAPQYSAFYGTIEPSGTIEVDSGCDLTIHMNPDPGYSLSALIIDGQEIEYLPDNRYTFQAVCDDHTIEVRFDPEEKDTLHFSYDDPVNPRDLLGDGEYAFNKPIPISALPIEEYRFVNWQVESGDADIVDPSDPHTIVYLHSEATLSAVYQEDDSLLYAIDVSPRVMNFRDVEVGTIAHRELTLTNTGNADARVTDLTVQGAEFGFSAQLPSIIAPGESEVIPMSFSPTTEGIFTESMTIINQPEGMEAQIVTMSVYGIAVEPHTWNLTVSPSIFTSDAEIGFDAGDFHAGEEAHFSLYRIYRGSAQRDLIETFTQVTTSGANTFTRPVWNYLPLGFYTLEMSNAQGDQLDNASFEKLSYEVDYQMSATPEQSSGAVEISFYNPSPYIEGDSAELVISNDATSLRLTETIAYGANIIQTDVASSYHPQGVYEVVLLIDGEAVDTTSFEKVAQDYTLSPSVQSIDFGTVAVGETVEETVELTNTGNASALISSMTTSEMIFSVVESTPISVEPGESVTLTVRFSPSLAEASSGALSITNAPDMQIQTVEIDLQGVGQQQTAPSMHVAMSVDGDIVGNSIRPSFTISNASNDFIDLSNIVVEYYTYDPSANTDALEGDIYYCSNGNATVTSSFMRLDQTYGAGTQKADVVTVLGFTDGDLAPGESLQLQIGIREENWQYTFDESDDWSRVVAAGAAEFVVIRDSATGQILFGSAPAEADTL
ncbi:MAG: C25 family cysteine peptidase [Chitinivibrionales bacterium]